MDEYIDLTGAPELLRPGAEVEVSSTYDGGWSRGFEVADVTDAGDYRVRRRSDGTVLPVTFNRGNVRAAR